MKSSNLSASIRAKLTNLAGKLDRDFNGLALEFAIERLIARLQSDPKLAKALIFKGGFVMLKSYGSNRTTVDLDTSIHALSLEEAEKSARSVIEREYSDGVWMGAIEAQAMDHQTEYAGLRLTIRFSIGVPKVDSKRLGKLVLDIGVADAITPGPTTAQFQPILGGESISWKVYPAETIVAEKLHALISHGSINSRFKDIFDLAILLPKCDDVTLLNKAIDRTFTHRSTERPISIQKYWQNLDKSALKRAVGAVFVNSGSVPDFEDLDKQLTDLLKILG
jgi:hypothetical protein